MQVDGYVFGGPVLFSVVAVLLLVGIGTVVMRPALTGTVLRIAISTVLAAVLFGLGRVLVSGPVFVAICAAISVAWLTWMRNLRRPQP